ncbi:sulfotransferase domain-containing protein [Thalassotalea sp. PS06]|uniref:sulfotransferase domain-containing protein n=1 Tax=Thalassotalea sp. PS06 TaxID=2594005 RepID=UPI0011622D42|nr:sulfotransferase domain-containing protein [Thalassotalea sp. PS06]QDP01990.1 sulfotransferase domain-containing protein [Thalassotalea sp. PS06]
MNTPSKVQKLLFRKVKSFLKLGSDPDFFILGAQKAGTTSLFKYIEQAGVNFKPPRQKELYFYTENYSRGKGYYRSAFPFWKGRNSVSGEATPDYLFHHKVPEHLAQHHPEAKLVILLRDPIDRAFSQYNHQNFTNKTSAYDPLDFSRAIRTESERYQVHHESPFFYEYKYFSYKARGLYEEQIIRYKKLFNEEQLLFLDISDLKNELKIKEVFDFLGITIDTKKLNLNEKYNSNKTFKMLDQDRAYLLEFYKGKFQSLETLTGRSFPWLSPYLK